MYFILLSLSIILQGIYGFDDKRLTDGEVQTIFMLRKNNSEMKNNEDIYI